MNTKLSKILGGLVGAATGDAIGKATEFRNSDMIVRHFGGWVCDFVASPSDNLSKGTPPGYVTDDFSIAYYTAKEILENKGNLTEDVVRKALIKWYDDGGYTQFIGPTTKKSILRMKGEKPPVETPLDEIRHRLLCDSSLVTNGGGMKAGMMGLFHPGDADSAIDAAIVMCLPTHNTVNSLSAACAIASATASAFKQGASYYDVIEAGIYGAKEGYRRSDSIARPASGSDIVRKIQLSIEIGLRNQDDPEKAMREIANIIGGGLWAYEAIPAVFGHIAACRGESMPSILMGVNAGNDTDTVACMTGYITGALNGIEFLPAKAEKILDEANGFRLRKMAEAVDRITGTSEGGEAA